LPDFGSTKQNLIHGYLYRSGGIVRQDGRLLRESATEIGEHTQHRPVFLLRILAMPYLRARANPFVVAVAHIVGVTIWKKSVY
jgi:hypothetical protein